MTCPLVSLPLADALATTPLSVSSKGSSARSVFTSMKSSASQDRQMLALEGEVDPYKAISGFTGVSRRNLESGSRWAEVFTKDQFVATAGFRAAIYSR